ncbi:MAG: PstC family ABC transporter permease, partial [Ilumatobacteraceae bacterium]
FDGWPVLGSIFGEASSGRTFMTAGLILAVMITPIITSIAREVILTTPQTDCDGALALGATRWEMITGAVMPHSLGGIVGAVMLGLGRAMGETIAVALVIGSSPAVTSNLFSSGDSLPSVIAFQWGEATTDIKRSALVAMGLTLFVLTIIVNFSATAIVNRATRRIQGSV